jgi:hypothetical protein
MNVASFLNMKMPNIRFDKADLIAISCGANVPIVMSGLKHPPFTAIKWDRMPISLITVSI